MRGLRPLKFPRPRARRRGKPGRRPWTSRSEGAFQVTASYRLVIGSKNTSSWSLRPWLAMKRFAIAFEEVLIDLRAPDKKQQILAHTPSGKVPALEVDGFVIWDSLA